LCCCQFALHVNGCVYEAKKQLIMKIVDEGHPAGLYDLATFTDIRTCVLYRTFTHSLSLTVSDARARDGDGDCSDERDCQPINR
jgi:hypothetical protein